MAEFRRRAGLTQEQVAEQIGITAEMVRRHERGAAMPIPLYRARYVALFGAAEGDLWLSVPTGPGDEIALISGGRPAPELSTSLALPVHYEYGDDEYLQTVYTHIREIVALENRFGGTDLLRLSHRFFRSLHQQIGTGAFATHLRRDLLAGAGELAELVGWLAYDAEEHGLVRRMNQEALYFTRLAGDRSIELLTLQNASMHAAAIGRPMEALQLAESVLEGTALLSPRLRAMFLTRRARALALAGNPAALRLFADVRSLYEEGLSSTDPAWAWWIDDRELLWQEAMAHRDLGRPGPALDLFERSAAAGPSTGVRSQYIHHAYLLRAQVDTGAWVDAETTIRELLPLVGDVASTRTVVLLRSVTDRLPGDGGVPKDRLLELAQLAGALDLAPV